MYKVKFVNKWFKYVLIGLLCQCGTTYVIAQNFGNEWIKYSQNYIRIDVVGTGIYRIPYQVLASAYQQMGLDISTVNYAGFQVYGRGSQVPIYIYSPSSTYMQEGSYIEFYAERNDGWFDKQLYPNELQTNPYYSLYNDTAAYYLTWSDKLTGLRYAMVTDQNYSLYNTLPYFKTEKVAYFAANYTEGELYSLNMASTLYNSCEGWVDRSFGQGYGVNKTIQTPNPYTGGPQAEISIGVCGLSSPKHHLNVNFCGQTFDTIYTGYKFFKIDRKVPASNLNLSNTFEFKSINDIWEK